MFQITINHDPYEENCAHCGAEVAFRLGPMVLMAEPPYRVICSPCLFILSPYFWKDFYEMVHNYTEEDYEQDRLDSEECDRRRQELEAREYGEEDDEYDDLDD